VNGTLPLWQLIAGATALLVAGWFFVVLWSGKSPRIDPKESPFHERAYAISIAKGKWMIALTLLVFSALIAALILILTADAGKPIDLYLRIGAAPPFVFAIWFCAAQYSRERRLEEESLFRGGLWKSMTTVADLFADGERKLGQHPEVLREYLKLLSLCASASFSAPTDKSTTTDDPDYTKTIEAAAKSTREISDSLSKVIRG
jgi:hypothetical protein